MKRFLSIILALVIMLTAVSAFSLASYASTSVSVQTNELGERYYIGNCDNYNTKKLDYDYVEGLSYYVINFDRGTFTLYPDSSGSGIFGSIHSVLGTSCPYNDCVAGYHKLKSADKKLITDMIFTCDYQVLWSSIHCLPGLKTIRIYNDAEVDIDKNGNFGYGVPNDITLYGTTQSHKDLAEKFGFIYKDLSECSVEPAADSNINIWEDIKTITGIDAATTKNDLVKSSLNAGGCDIEIDKGKDEYVGTGDKADVVKWIDGTVADSYTLLIYGDVDGDGLYDATDAYKVNLIINGWLTREQVGEAAWAAADCNHDGVIDSLDAELLERAGLLLSQIDQSKPQSEIVTSDEYIEYQSLIDQSPEPQESEPDITPEPDPEPEPTVFEQIVSFIRQIVEYILSFVKRLYK